MRKELWPKEEFWTSLAQRRFRRVSKLSSNKFHIALNSQSDSNLRRGLLGKGILFDDHIHRNLKKSQIEKVFKKVFFQKGWGE